jgi:hypothetical protein
MHPEDEKRKLALTNMDCRYPFSPSNHSGVTVSTLKSLRHKVLSTPMEDHSGPTDSTLDSLTRTVPSTPTSMEEYSGPTQELTVPSTLAPMEDHSGLESTIPSTPTLMEDHSGQTDATLENSVPVILEITDLHQMR